MDLMKRLRGPQVTHACSKECTFNFVLDFVANTQNPSMFNPRLEENTVPSLMVFLDGNRDEMRCSAPP